MPFDWAREAARHVGTVAHRLFAQIARDGIAAQDASRVASLAPRLRTELAAAGVDEAELAAAAAEVTAAVSRMLADPRGRWLLRPAHSEAMQRMGAGGMGRDEPCAHRGRPHIRGRGRALDRATSRRGRTKARTARRFSIANRSAIATSSSATPRSCARSMRARSGSVSITRCSAAGANGRTTAGRQADGQPGK